MDNTPEGKTEMGREWEGEVKERKGRVKQKREEKGEEENKEEQGWEEKCRALQF